MQITEHLIFYPDRGLFQLSEGIEKCIAATGKYITPLFVVALSGELAEKYPNLLRDREWQIFPINTTFVSYSEICHYVSLLENEAVQASILDNEKEALDRLVRIYLEWVIEEENEIVRSNPSVWLEPAFYPSGIFAENGDFDLYNRYDSIPIGGFARSALYFFIANTAKKNIISALHTDDLFCAFQKCIKDCKAIFEDYNNIHIQPGLKRNLLDAYLAWSFNQNEVDKAHDVSLSNDDLWQIILNKELRAYKLFDKKLVELHLFDLRPLLELQKDLITRIQKDHPYISTSNKNIVPSNLPRENSYTELVRWLEDEKKDGRDHLGDYDGNVAAMCADSNFRRKIGWHSINENSLRKALNRKNKKK